MPLKYKDTDIIRLYYKTEDNQIIEVKHLKNIDNQTIHKRVDFTFITDITQEYTKTRTWGVQTIEPDPLPQEFQNLLEGWSTVENSEIPDVNFPMLAPKDDANYYVVWKQGMAPRVFVVEAQGSMELLGSVSYDKLSGIMREYSIDGSLDITSTLEYAVGHRILRSFEVNTETLLDATLTYEVGRRLMKEYALSSSLETTASMTYELAKRILMEYNIETGLDIDAELSYEIGRSIMKQFTVETDLNIGAKVDYNLDKIYGVTYALVNNMVLNSELDYTIGRRILEQYEVKAQGDLEAAITYEFGKGILKDYEIDSNLDSQAQLDYLLSKTYGITRDIKMALSAESKLTYLTGKGIMKQYDASSNMDLSSQLNYTLDKIQPPPTYYITQGGTATPYWFMGMTSYQESTSPQSFNINYSRSGWEISSVTITRIAPYGGPAPIVTGTSPTSRTVTIPAGSYGDFRVDLSQKEVSLPKTATPSITGNPTCTSEAIGGNTYLNFSVKNNDSSQVTIRNNSTVLGTIPANGTRTFSISYPLPGSYNLSITAQASNKERSDNVNKSGNISFCVAM